jgi:hypothetical protein
VIALYTGRVALSEPWTPGVRKLTVAIGEGGERPALCYEALCGPCPVGDDVLVNGTAVDLGLGTGGFDFVVANRSRAGAAIQPGPGHVIKCRYLPCQIAVEVLEEKGEHKDVWDRDLDTMPVVAAELHSQIVPIAFGVRHEGPVRIAYVMTDTAALPLGLSQTIARARADGLLDCTITCGQAFGGDYETVTLYSALLAARHIAKCEVAIVCQGPGNAGTATKYGFGGVDQAHVLDAVGKLGGAPIAAVRMSGADARARHHGVSHHTRTCLELTHHACAAPVPPGVEAVKLGSAQLVVVPDADEPVQAMIRAGWDIRSMGRDVAEDPLFFRAAAAAGLYAARIAIHLRGDAEC